MAFSEHFDWPLDKGQMSDGWFEGLPYPLYDMRPQGFLGRNFAHLYGQQLQVTENLYDWSDDDIVHVLATLGHDQSGDLILGEQAHISCTWKPAAVGNRVCLPPSRSPWLIPNKPNWHLPKV